MLPRPAATPSEPAFPRRARWKNLTVPQTTRRLHITDDMTHAFVADAYAPSPRHACTQIVEQSASALLQARYNFAIAWLPSCGGAGTRG